MKDFVDEQRELVIRAKELEALRARSQGLHKQAEQLERQVEIMKQAVAFANRYGMELKAAFRLAQQIKDNEPPEEKSKKEDEPNTRSGGISSMASIGGGGGVGVVKPIEKANDIAEEQQDELEEINENTKPDGSDDDLLEELERIAENTKEEEDDDSTEKDQLTELEQINKNTQADDPGPYDSLLKNNPFLPPDYVPPPEPDTALIDALEMLKKIAENTDSSVDPFVEDQLARLRELIGDTIPGDEDPLNSDMLEELRKIYENTKPGNDESGDNSMSQVIEGKRSLQELETQLAESQMNNAQNIGDRLKLSLQPIEKSNLLMEAQLTTLNKIEENTHSNTEATFS
jgi:hypothetical protein